MKTRAKAKPPAAEAEWDLRLYISGSNAKSTAAFKNLEQLCQRHLAGRYHIEVIDLVKTPQLAQGDQILALPTLVRHLPMPIRKVVGNLSDTERVVVGLDLRPHDADPFTPWKGEKRAR